MKEKIKFFRNFGALSDDSVVTDIYKKRYRKNIRRRKTKAKRCVIRQATDEEIRKYNIEEKQMDLDNEELKATKKRNSKYISKDEIRKIMASNTELNAYYKIKELVEKC